MRRRAAVAVLAVGVLVPTLAGCGSPITATALAGRVGPTFARLYALQQGDLGRAAPARGPDGSARCGRGGAVSGGRGAGDDWTCTVAYPFADGHLEPIVYDVTVSPTGCFTADGPGAVVGQASITTSSGRRLTNPLFAFDGCLDLG